MPKVPNRRRLDYSNRLTSLHSAAKEPIVEGLSHVALMATNQSTPQAVSLINASEAAVAVAKLC